MGASNIKHGRAAREDPQDADTLQSRTCGNRLYLKVVGTRIFRRDECGLSGNENTMPDHFQMQMNAHADAPPSGLEPDRK